MTGCICAALILILCGCLNTSSKTESKAAANDTANTINIEEWDRRWTIQEDEYVSPRKWYSETRNNGVIIQTSLPRNASGKSLDRRIFLNRIINESAVPISLIINFQTDSFQISSSPDAYVKLFFPPDTLKRQEFGLSEFVASGVDSLVGPVKSGTLQKNIKPDEEFVFYTGVAIYKGGGRVRGGLVLKEQELFYRISIENLDEGIFPCGKIVFKK